MCGIKPYTCVYVCLFVCGITPLYLPVCLFVCGHVVPTESLSTDQEEGTVLSSYCRSESGRTHIHKQRDTGTAPDTAPHLVPINLAYYNITQLAGVWHSRETVSRSKPEKCDSSSTPEPTMSPLGEAHLSSHSMPPAPSTSI